MLRRIKNRIHEFIHNASYHPESVEIDVKRFIDTRYIDNAFNCVYLGDNLMLCKMKWGSSMVVPTWNMDVAVGAIRDGIIEEAITKFLMSTLKQGDKFINIGTNFGYYTCLGGMIVGPDGHVWGFEANPIMFRILMKNLFYSGIINHTDIYNRAVTNTYNEEITFGFDYQYIGGGNIFVSIDSSKSRDNLFWNTCDTNLVCDNMGKYVKGTSLMEFIKVRTTTLDAVFSEEEVDYIFCDAEGSEPYIIMGAKELIRRSPNLKIVFEYTSDPYDKNDNRGLKAILSMLDFFKEEGFVIRRISPYLINGEVKLSDPLSREDMLHQEQADFYATRE